MKAYFLADDLSGALDAAAAFYHAGRRVRIVLQAEDWTTADEDEVVGVTTETRNLGPRVAAEAVAGVLARGRALGARLVYKKIDSTLRGPVVAELAALAAAMPEARIVLAPANPRAGRVVREGVLLVRGVPVAQTEFGRDPLSPVRESSIRQLLEGSAADHVLVPDTETEEDLAAAVDRVDDRGAAWVGVGSGALARAVAARVFGAGPARQGEAAALPRGPVLLIGGSAHPANRSQVEFLVRTQGMPVHEMRLGDPAGVVEPLLASLRARSAAVLTIEPRRFDSAAVLAAVTAVAARAVREGGVRRVFATGGETAFALCRSLGVGSLDFLDEIEPGLGLATGLANEGPMLLAIKPGGFGDERTWIRAWARLQNQS